MKNRDEHVSIERRKQHEALSIVADVPWWVG